MKKIVFLFIILTTTINNAQAPNWAWAKSVNSNYSNYPTKTLTDTEGNSYTLGRFYFDITFNNIVLNANYFSYYIVKNDSNGNFIWAKKFDSHLTYNINIFDIDPNNNLMIGGDIELENFTGSLNFNDEQTINFNSAYVYTGNKYFFLFKVDNDGNIQWIKTNSGKSSPLNDALDNQNNSYVFGEYNSQVQFDDIILQTSNAKEYFLIKNNIDGTTQWGKSFGQNNPMTNFQMKCINNQYLLLTGVTFSETFQYDNNTFQIGGSNTYKLIILKTDLNGNLISFNYIPNVPYQSDHNNQNLIDEFGDIYLFGNSSDPTITFGNTTLNRVGVEDLYLAKYSSDAQLIWARNYGCTNCGLFFDNLYTQNNNLYLATDYYNPNGSSITLNNSTFNINGSSYTTLIMKLDNNGNYIWLKNAIGISNTNGNSPSTIIVDSNEKVMISGQYNCQNILFDNFQLLSTNSMNNYERSFFAQISDSSLSTSENDLNLSAIIYPNPINSILNIAGNSEIIGKEYVIIDVFGRITNKGIINSETSSLETGNLKSGVYFIKIQNNTPIKFIKQ